MWLLLVAFQIAVASATGADELGGDLQAECEEGIAVSCVRLGVQYELGSISQQKEAARLYRRGCELHNPVGCKGLARMYAEGRGVAESYGEAVRLYHRAAELTREECRKGNRVYCLALGLSYANGDGIPQDCKEGIRLIREGCTNGLALACSDLGERYEEGKQNRCLAKDMDLARHFYGAACSLQGGSDACLRLGEMYEKGIDVTPDPVKAIGFYLKGCRENPESNSCFNLKSVCGRHRYPGCP